MARPRACAHLYPSLFNLPDPLLDKLLAQVDDISLVELSATCRRFNTKALTTFFARHKLRDSPGVLSHPKLPHISLKATRRAIFVHSLHTLHYSFRNTEKLFADVHDMTQLVERLAHVSHVTFYFTELDRWIRDAGRGHGLDRVAWKEALSTLVDKVLDRGCESLHVAGGGQRSNLYWGSLEMQKRDALQPIEPTAAILPMAAQPHNDLPIALSSTAVSLSNLSVQRSVPQSLAQETIPAKPSGLLSIFRKKSKKTPAAFQLTTKCKTLDGADDAPILSESTTQLGPASTSQTPSSIQHGKTIGIGPVEVGLTKKIRILNIHSKMLLDDPFFDWTIATITASASTLTTLSFNCRSVHTDVWHKVLDSLYLPHLHTFKFAAAAILGPRHPDLRYFLAANPTITTLSLYGLAKDSAPLTPLMAPILPNILNVEAEPYYITWLLSNITINCASMPHLASITIRTRCFDSALFDFDNAIVSVADVQRKMTLCISLAGKSERGIQLWLQHHIQNRHTTPFRLLDHIQDLIISPIFYSNITVPVLHLLPEWLNLFPGLRSLRLENLPPKVVQWIDDVEFKQILADRCPKLESMSTRWAEEFSLGELRGKIRAMEDGSGGPDSGLEGMDDPILDGSG